MEHRERRNQPSTDTYSHVEFISMVRKKDSSNSSRDFFFCSFFRYFVAVSGGDRGLCVRTTNEMNCSIQWDGSFFLVSSVIFGNIQGVSGFRPFKGRVDSLKLFSCQLSVAELDALSKESPASLIYAEDFRNQSPWSMVNCCLHFCLAYFSSRLAFSLFERFI